MPLINSVRTFFRQQNIEHTTGVIAISGGPDSVALAHVLIELSRQGLLGRVVLAHVNHLLRGDESDADEAFVLKLAEAWDIPCRTTRIDVAGEARQQSENLEKTARELRYAWLTEVVRAENAGWLATGHSADDQAETVLHRLLRGTGLQGLTAIARRRPLCDRGELIRPLLDVRRADILAHLQAENLAFCQDRTNLDLSFTRNRLRLELLPHLAEQYQPAIVEVLCRLADQAQAVQSEIARLTDELFRRAELPRAGPLVILQAEVLAAASHHLVCEAFRRLWQREHWPMDAMDHRAWLRLADLAHGQSGGGDDYPGGIRARRRGNVVQLGPAHGFPRSATARSID